MISINAILTGQYHQYALDFAEGVAAMMHNATSDVMPHHGASIIGHAGAI